MINKYTGLPRRSSILYISFVLIMLAYLAHAYMTEASSFDDYPYSVAPRLLHNCESKWVGTEYHPLPTCTKVWGMLTRETILSESDYFSNLTFHE